MCDGKKAASAGKAKSDEPCDASRTTCPGKKRDPKRIRYIMIRYIRFLSDHKVMKDNFTDYKNTGSLLSSIHWKQDKAVPISHTSDKAMELEIEYEVGPRGAIPETGSLTGSVRGNEWFRHDGINFTPGTKKLQIKYKGEALEKRIAIPRYSFNWKIDGITVTPSPSVTQHDVILTVDTPQGYTGDSEPGVTLRRLYHSAKLVGPMDSVDSHTVVKGLMTRLGAYVLQPDPDVPPQYGHPTYYRHVGGRLMPNNEGGAWPMMDYLDKYGECQAIVRFVGNVIKQLGMPGNMEMVFVFARPDNPFVAAEDKMGGLGHYRGYALVDQKVTLNQVYPPSHSRLSGGGSSAGFNNYEACLKFTDQGVTKYYGGGTQGADHDTAQEVLKSFYALVKVEGAWYPNETHPRKVMGLKIIQILAKRKDW